jgi:aryl sulfotransferase
MGPPVKRRELQNHHMDSTVWNDFVFRDGDIVIATYMKTGTTWMQQIVAQLLSRGTHVGRVSDTSPWLDHRVSPRDTKLAMLAAQTGRRSVKTHLPADALVYSPRARYVYIARDGRDVVWSMYNHHLHANGIYYRGTNETPGLVGPPFPRMNLPQRAYFRRWLAEDGYPFWPFWEHIRSWWDIRGLENLLLVHFAELRADLAGQVRRIAGFLDISLTEAEMEDVVAHCGFAYMKANADWVAPRGGIAFDGGGNTFINRGSNGRWRDTLTGEDIAHYEATALRELGPDCAAWLAGPDALVAARH